MTDGVIHSGEVILHKLAAQQPIDATGRITLHSSKLQELTKLSPAQLNDAIELLEESGLIEVMRSLGTYPYTFYQITITPRGKYEVERKQTEISPSAERPVESSLLPPAPIGSPFGFTDEDWEVVAERKAKVNEISVVFGYQFESKHYDTDLLKQNVQSMFQKAVEEYKKQPGAFNISLAFKPLAAGYGEHLFNEIARDIIPADIAVFDASDLNPNVMLEMGVALTWGVRVLPIRREGTPKPPSDISGQTWAEYLDNAKQFSDSEHDQKLMRMVERAAKKKGRPTT